MAVMESRPPKFSLAYEVGTGGRQTGVCFSLSRFSGDLLGEVACSSLPENLGRFSLILRARPPGGGSLRRIRWGGGVFANPFTTRGFA